MRTYNDMLKIPERTDPIMPAASDLLKLGLDRDSAERIASGLQLLAPPGDAAWVWNQLTACLLKGEHPFALHQYLRDRVFEGWQNRQDPIPLWCPSPESVGRSNLGQVMRELAFEDYASLHRWSVTDPEGFWGMTIARLGIQFRRQPSRVLDLTSGPEAAEWLPGAILNICESCFQAGDDAIAIVSGSVSGEIRTLSYGELDALASRVARGLINEGLVPGDPIAMYIDMSPESVAIYLGIIKAGCVVVSIAESFAPPEIRTRLRITGAKAVFTARSILRQGRSLPLYEKLIQADAPKAVVLDDAAEDGAPLRQGDLRWCDFLGDEGHFEAHACRANDWIHVLVSSGTTGEPKAIPWSHLTPIKCASDAHYHHDLRPGDVVCWPTSLGWMMGPWLLFATLINRGTIALFDDVPTTRAFGEFVARAKVNVLGVVPSIVRQWRATGCMEGLDWSQIKLFSSTGECSDPDDMHYLMYLAGYRPIIEYCGGTEIGGGYIASTFIQPNAPSTFSGPALGSDFVILDDHDAPADVGELFLIPPALGLSTELLNLDHHACYFEGTPAGPRGEVLRRHGDEMQRLPGGYYRALGRADDTMKLGGIKVSSAEIERVLIRLEGVREVAAVGIALPGGGPNRLVIFAVTGPDSGWSPQDLQSSMQQALRQELNPLFKIEEVRLVEQLPRTASNKVMRRQLRSDYRFCATI